MRLQFGGAVVLMLVPYVVRGAWLETFAVPETVYVSLIASILSTLAAGAFFRNLSRHPGIQSTAYILPCVLIPFGIAAIVLLLGRPDYSRVILASGLLLSLCWYYLVYIMQRRQRAMRIGLVPFGEVDQLNRVPGVSWQRLSAPDLSSHQIDAVAADLGSAIPDEWERALADFTLSGVPVYDFKQLIESLTGRVQIDHISENGFGALAPLDSYLRARSAVERIAALVLLVVFSPILLAVAIAVRLDSEGPSFFLQERIGYRGVPFSVIKFRTMRCAPAEADARTAAITRSNDNRITRLGRFLRTSRIDEIPQLINVIKGEMSFIGPRPEASVLSRWYEQEIPFYRYRHIVPPGITGWAQVNQGHVAEVDDVREKLRYDFYYIRHFSLWLDFLIVMHTVRTVLTGFGSR